MSDPDPTVPVDPAVLADLVAISEATGLSLAALVADALESHVIRMAGEPGDPPATEFRKVASDRQAQAVLRQDTDLDFIVLEPFVYSGDAGTWEVPRGMRTDLASVPGPLTWLVPRYGRHTLAALVHDLLQREEYGVSSWDADAVFRDSMRTAGVPFVRRWAMWAAVATRTLFKKPGWTWPMRILIVGWMLAYGLGVGVVGWGWVGREAWRHGPGLLLGEVAVIVVAAVLAGLQDRTRTEPGGSVVPARFARAARVAFPFAAGGVIGWSVAAALILVLRGDTPAVAIQLGLVASPLAVAIVWSAVRRGTYAVGLIMGVAVSLLAIPGVFVVWALLVYRAAEAFAGLSARGRVPVTEAEVQIRMAAAAPAEG